MSVDKRIKDRMADAVARSYFKPWYKRGWGKFALFFVIIGILSILYLASLVVLNLRRINQGLIYNPDFGTWISNEDFLENQKLVADLLTEDDPWLGAEEPLVFVVAYESFGCPFCKEDQVEQKKMLAKFSSVVRFIFKDFPTEGLHPNVFEAHLAAACAEEQNRFWEYHDVLYTNQTEEGFKNEDLKRFARELGLNEQQFNECLDSEKYQQEIRQDYAVGAQQGVVGTPTYVVNGNLLPGSIPFEIWEDVIGFILQESY